MEAPSSRQRLVAIVIGTAVIALIIWFNLKLVTEVKQGAEPATTPLPVITPAP